MTHPDDDMARSIKQQQNAAAAPHPEEAARKEATCDECGTVDGDAVRRRLPDGFAEQDDRVDGVGQVPDPMEASRVLCVACADAKGFDVNERERQ